MTKRKPVNIALFIDGYTLKKVNEYYRYFHPYHARLDFRSIKNWARREALRNFFPKFRYCNMECHYYHPTRKDNSFGLVSLERELNYAGINVHYSDVSKQEWPTPNLDLIEDAKTLAIYKRMDAAILLSTQGQYAPFPERLRMFGIPTLLLGWSFRYPKADRWVHWKTDSELKEKCAKYVAMEKIADRNPPSEADIAGLFRMHGHPVYHLMQA